MNKRIKGILFDVKNLIKYNNPYLMIKRHLWAKKYYETPVLEEINMNKSNFDIYTVAFNNVEVIDYQIRLIQKYLQDEHFHIIADNSNDQEKSEKIRELCVKYGVGYIKLPENILFCSLSHGAALNYLYKNYIEKRKPKYFGLLDHDIFPVKKTSILDHFGNQDFYGYLVDKYRRGYIYGNQRMLRPGFSFYKFGIFNEFNFFTAKGLFPRPYALDTGGGNRRLIFRKFKKDEILFCDRKLIGIDKNGGEKETLYDIFIDGKLVEHNFVQTYELIQNGERIHRGGTFVWNYNDKQQVNNLNKRVANFLENLDKYL